MGNAEHSSDLFEPGAIVMLRSGGPKMTVRDNGLRIKCNWFDGNALMAGEFPRASLQIIGEPLSKKPITIDAGPIHPR